MAQTRREFIRATSVASFSAVPAVKTLAAALGDDPDHFNNLIDADFNNALEFRLIDNNLLNLHFYFINVFKKRKYLYKGLKDHAYMIIRLPQMHITEKGYWKGDEHNFPAGKLSGFSYLAFELWPKKSNPGGKSVAKQVQDRLLFSADTFLKWNNVQTMDLITLVEWFDLKGYSPDSLKYQNFKDTLDAKILRKKDIRKLNDITLPKSEVFAKYYAVVNKFLGNAIKEGVKPNPDFVPITFFEIPQAVCVVPIYRDGDNFGAAQNEQVKKVFWENKRVNLENENGLISRTYEVWNNALFLKRQNKPCADGSKTFSFETPTLKIAGMITEQTKDDPENYLPSFLDKATLTYLLQYANGGGEQDLTKPVYDLQIKGGLFFTGLGVVTHFSYANRYPPPGIDLIEYEHTISEGRDVFIKVAYLGYNSKTGQAYKHTIEGQRQIDLDTVLNGNQRYDALSFVYIKQYCECLDPEIDYLEETDTINPGNFPCVPILAPNKILGPLPGNECNRLRFPFTHIKVKEKKRIPVDCLQFDVQPRTVGAAEGPQWFWPLIERDANFSRGAVGVMDHEIPIASYLNCDHEALDWDGNTISANTPYMFLRRNYIEGNDYTDAYASYIKGNYRAPDSPEGQDPLVERRRTYYNSQRIAFTPSAIDNGAKKQTFASRTNQLETLVGESYFHIRKIEGNPNIAKMRYVLFPQLLQAEVHLEHIKELTQKNLSSFIEYHENYLKYEFNEEGNHLAQIVRHTDAFIASTRAGADAAQQTLSRDRDALLNALQEGKDKLGNLVIPDIQPETLALKAQGVTLPVQTAMTKIKDIVHLNPKDLLKGQFSEILGGIDLKQILDDLIPEDNSPLFEIKKAVSDLQREVYDSPVYQEITDKIAKVKNAVDEFRKGYEKALNTLNETKNKINKDLKVISKEIPDSEQIRNCINKQFEQAKTEAFNLILEKTPIEQVKAAIENKRAEAKAFMDAQVSFVKDQVTTYKDQLTQLIDDLQAQLDALEDADRALIPEVILEVGPVRLDLYLKTNLATLYPGVGATLLIDYDKMLDNLFRTDDDSAPLQGFKPGSTITGKTIRYNPDSYQLSDSSGIPVTIFDPSRPFDTGFVQLDKKLNFYRTLVAKNSNGNVFQQAAVAEIQFLFDKLNNPNNYQKIYEDIQGSVAKLQDDLLGKLASDITFWKNKYDQFDARVITPAGRAVLIKVHDLFLKATPYVDLLRKLDPYFYYREYLRLKQDAEDIRKRFVQPLYDAYMEVLKDVTIIKDGASGFNQALTDFAADHDLKKFQASTQTITANLDGLSVKVFQKAVAKFPEAQAAMDELYEGVNPLVVAVKTQEKDYLVLYSKYEDYVRTNASQLGDELSKIVGDFIVEHQEEIEVVNAARNLYNLLTAIKQQDLSYTWDTNNFRDVNLGIIAFKKFSNPDTRLSVNVRVTTIFTPGKFPPTIQKVETFSENKLSNFGVSVFNILTVVFSEVSFSAGTGQSTHFDVKIRAVQFDGALAFVQKFEDYLKTMDAGLILDLEPDHVALGYSLPIPSIQTPGFAFFNLSLNFSFILYFDKRPLSLGFSLATAENKFGIAVYIFAGFGFFSIVAEPKRGIVSIDAALEAGVWAGFSLGPIHGEVKLAFGFRYTKGDFGTRLEGYIVAEGRLAIWIIEVSARIYLGIISENSSAAGVCTVTYSVKLGFFKKSFSGTFYKQIKGAESNHQEQAATNYDRNHASSLLLAKQLSIRPGRSPHNASLLVASVKNISTAEYKTNYITAKITADADADVTETYNVTRKDWDDYFDRFK